MNSSKPNSFLLAAIATAAAVEIVLIMGVHVPWLQAHPFWLGIVFIVAVMVATSWVLYSISGFVAEKEIIPMHFWLFVCVVELLLAFFMASAVFQMAIYWRRPQMAQGVFDVLTALAVVHKCFASEIYHWVSRLWSLILNMKIDPKLRGCFEAFFVALILAVIYIPDLEAVIARDFIGQQHHHMDSAFMGPGLAYLGGGTLNIDATTYYGLGMPIFMVQLTKLLGGLTYLNGLKVLVSIGIVYFLLWYLLLRCWLSGGFWIAATAILLGIRTQMFHQLVSPFIWTVPSATVYRFCFDIFFFWAIWAHLKTSQWRYLVVAGFISALAVFHMTSTGMALLGTFYVYIFCLMVTPHLRASLYQRRRDLRLVVMILLWPLLAGFVIFYEGVGSALFQHEFWVNSREFMHHYLSFFATAPIINQLKEKSFILVLVGFLFLIGSVFTLVYVSTMVYLNKLGKDHLMAVLLSIYGLALYQYYVIVSSTYYSQGLPIIFLLFYWLGRWVSFISQQQRRVIGIALMAACLYITVTSHMFMGYPNVLNFSRNPMVDSKVAQLLDNRLYYGSLLFIQYPDAFKLPLNSLGEVDEKLPVEKDFANDQELKAYYRREVDFTPDVKLIQSLTPPGAKVPLVSSFEIEMLLQAKRRPFFYYCPLINSRPLRMRIFVTTHMFSKGQFQKVVGQLESQKPPYLFMEKIFLNRQVPQAYFYDSQDFINLMNYIWAHYTPSTEGHYLVAMKRLDS